MLSEREAMARALELAATPGVPLGPNPRVGAVVLDRDGAVVAEGFHRGAGTAHGEADALSRAGSRAFGSTVVVTLEPCNHTGRTGPCSQALLQAGVSRVVYAMPDPNPVAAGGAQTLSAAGVEVVAGVLEEEARALNRAWLFGIEHGRPLVTWKYAATLDGRIAAPDATSRWISNRASRADTHRLRAQCDTVLVGTQTVVADDPRLTVRDAQDVPAPHQPLRAVMGVRDLDAALRVFDDGAATVRLRTHDPREALAELFALGQRHVFLEGGATVAAAFLRGGLVDEVVAYVAPVLLGAGPPALADLGISTLSQALRPQVTDVTVLASEGEQPDVRVTLRLR